MPTTSRGPDEESLVARLTICGVSSNSPNLFLFRKKEPPNRKSMTARLTVRLLETSAGTPTTELLGLAPVCGHTEVRHLEQQGSSL